MLNENCIIPARGKWRRRRVRVLTHGVVVPGLIPGMTKVYLHQCFISLASLYNLISVYNLPFQHKSLFPTSSLSLDSIKLYKVIKCKQYMKIGTQYKKYCAS